MLAGVTGAALTLAGVRSPATGPLTLLFVLVTPGGVRGGRCCAGLTSWPRAIVAGAASVVLAASVAEVMLVTSGWSPRGGIAATAIACAVLGAAVLVLRRRSRPAAPLAAPAGESEPALEP